MCVYIILPLCLIRPATFIQRPTAVSRVGGHQIINNFTYSDLYYYFMIDGSFDQKVPSSQERAVAEYCPEGIRPESLVVEKVLTYSLHGVESFLRS